MKSYELDCFVLSAAVSALPCLSALPISLDNFITSIALYHSYNTGRMKIFAMVSLINIKAVGDNA